MKRTGTIITLILIISLIPLLAGCATDDDIPSITKSDVDGWITDATKNMQTDINTASDNATAAKNKADEAKARADEAYNKANETTSPSMSTLIAGMSNSDIVVLKEKLGITGSGGSTDNDTGDTSGVVYITYDPLLSVHNNPTYASNTATGQTNFVIRVTNGTTSYQIIKLFFTFNGSNSTDLQNCDLQVGNYTNPLVFEYSPPMGTTGVSSFVAFPNAGGNNLTGGIQLGPGQYVDLNCWIQLHTSTGTTWNITINPSANTI